MKDKTVNLFTYLIEYVMKRKLYFAIYLLLIPVLPIIRNFVIPEILGDFYNSLGDKNNGNKKLLYIILFISLAGFTTIFINFMSWRLLPEFYQYTVVRIYEYIYLNTYCNFENLKISEIILKISKMSSVFNMFLSMFKELFCNVLFAILFGFIYFYYKLNIRYVSIFFFFIVILCIIQFFNIKQITKLNKKKEETGDESYEELSDSLYNIGTVQNFQNIDNERKIINKSISKYSEIYYKSLIQSIGFDVITKFIITIMVFILGLFLWNDFKEKNISKKTLFQTSQVIILLAFICDFIGMSGRKMADQLGEIYDINNFFNENIPFDKECRQGNNIFQNGDIVYKHIYHKYDDTDKYSLENVSLTIKKGEKVALIGQSGSGKTTMIKLLLKQQPLLIGSITIGNINNKEISAEELSKHIMYIPQNPKLFNRTLYDNIIYGIKNPPSREEILSTMIEMNMSEISKVFKDKMDESVGRDGSSLSGGQKQILWLLRSLYRVKPIIILDEPTAALDKQNKKIVIDTIKKVSVGKTVIIISHDDIDSEFKQIRFKNGKLVDKESFSYFNL